MIKLSLLCLSALVLVFAGNAMAFHDGGVAECAGCHTMHNSQDGALVDPAHPTGNAYLLKYGNASDTCLSCHAAYGQFFGGEGYGPGGDFYWVTKTYSWSAHGHDSFSTGDSHGHNVISPANGLAADGTLTEAPGGDFLSSRLGCTSCHDPHGNMNFRLLYGSAVGPKYDGTRYNFTEEAPLAVGNGRTTYVGSGDETDAKHTVYKSGMSEWCSNCHTNFHSDNTTNFVHPTGENLGSTIAGNYNAYVSTEDLVSGDVSTSYLGLVPFEAVNADLGLVDTTNYTTGPAGTDQVMCVTCHRAHATAFPDIGRWDFGATLLNADSHPLATDTGATPEDVANKYYQYTFLDSQRSLCNKCHVKDLGDDLNP
jgi:hypothetical protein